MLPADSPGPHLPSCGYQVESTNTFSSSKTRLAKDCSERMKEEAFMEIMLVMSKTLKTVEVRQLCLGYASRPELRP